MLSKSITKLVQYGMETGLVPECEKNYTINLLLDVFHEDEYVEPEESFSDVDLEETLNELLDEAVKRGLIEDSVVYRDLFDTRLMNCLMPRPAQVVSIIRQDRITESFRSRSTIHHGASSILHMYITMSIASCSTASILR